MNETEVIEAFCKKDIQQLKGYVIGLIGPLGAGKTRLVKRILKNVDSSFENQVHSPTFNICNIYSSEYLAVHHFDLYRVESEEALYDIEIWESIDNQGVLIFIEWINQFPELVGKCDEIISISIDAQDQRHYHLDKK
ncbi:tRNA (adenosine(37)-N6)-threonylcarbamoyltransferase complex ATPase subunit type 1 TsaE [bacterium]|nr:tRNA (adenosine(37)-N6)-threonylcarbamoyltransferase complex ATPase subunit type 1 TsaE [bacterium]